jgi:hypothetical protein
MGAAMSSGEVLIWSGARIGPPDVEECLERRGGDAPPAADLLRRQLAELAEAADRTLGQVQSVGELLDVQEERRAAFLDLDGYFVLVHAPDEKA